MSAATGRRRGRGLTLEDVTVAYDGRPALDDVTLSVPHGAQVADRRAQRRRQVDALQGARRPAPGARGRVTLHGRARQHGERIGRLRAAARGDRLALPGHRARRRHDGPLRPSGLVPPARGAPTARWSRAAWTARHRRPRRARDRRALRRPAAARLPGPGAGPGAARPAARRALHRRRRGAREALLALLDAPARAGITVLGRTHDLAAAQRFELVALLNRRVIAYGAAVRRLHRRSTWRRRSAARRCSSTAWS